MSPRRNHLDDAVAPSLTGLSIAAGIAREAADAVPIVKQVLGVVVRILTLAEKIDKDREALHMLVKKSLQLAKRVKEVIGQRTLDEMFTPSLDRIYGEIAEFMEKHLSRRRLSRMFCYAFTVNHHVERLSRKLEDAVQELFMISLLTIGDRVLDTHLTVQDSTLYEGDFRILRHCDVNKLELLLGHKNIILGEDRHQLVQYHSARVNGELLVVRYLATDDARDAGETRTPGKALYERVISHDDILKELSTVQGSHRNVAAIYGWSKGSRRDRFTVFRSGFRPLFVIRSELSTITNVLLDCLFKEASEHLRRMGINWQPDGFYSFPLDDHLEPTIGLENDLHRTGAENDAQAEIMEQIHSLLWPLWMSYPSDSVSSLDAREAFAGCHDKRVNALLEKFETVGRQRYVVTKGDLSNTRTLSDANADGLLRMLKIKHNFGRAITALPPWCHLLLMLGKNHSHRPNFTLQVVYHARVYQDFIEVRGIYEDAERIVLDKYTLNVPDARRNEFKEICGIAPSREEYVYEELPVVTSGAGTYCVL